MNTLFVDNGIHKLLNHKAEDNDGGEVQERGQWRKRASTTGLDVRRGMGGKGSSAFCGKAKVRRGHEVQS